MASQRVILTDHARRQAQRRGVTEQVVIQVASAPEQVLAVHPGREVRQSRVSVGPRGQTHLVRVIADVVGQDIRVVTVYRTSKVVKYWRAP